MLQQLETSADRDLEKRIVEFLLSFHRLPLRQIRVAARDGTVTLFGQVRSFYEKQLCLKCCRHVAGVIRLIDQIEVT